MDENRLNLVLFGDVRVGKTSILQRILYDTFSEEYKSTLDDMYYCNCYLSKRATLEINFLDTSGDIQFPAMRRLYIKSAHAFLLVYDCSRPNTYTYVQQQLQEIKACRQHDFEEIPILIVGNKCELQDSDDESEFKLDETHHSSKIKRMKCSASQNYGIRHIFKTFLKIQKLESLLIEIDQETAIKERSPSSPLMERFKQLSLRSKKRSTTTSSTRQNLHKSVHISYSNPSGKHVKNIENESTGFLGYSNSILGGEVEIRTPSPHGEVDMNNNIVSSHHDSNVAGNEHNSQVAKIPGLIYHGCGGDSSGSPIRASPSNIGSKTGDKNDENHQSHGHKWTNSLSRKISRRRNKTWNMQEDKIVTSKTPPLHKSYHVECQIS